MFQKKTAILCALALFAGTAVSASAAQFDNSEVRVQIGDLNLATSAGQQVLHSRVQHAANQICGNPLDFRNLPLRAQSRACQNDVMSKALPQVHQMASATASTGEDVALANNESRATR